MAESRGRLVTVVDFATLYSQSQRRSGTLGILRDEPEQSSNLLESSVTRKANAAVARGQSRGGGRGGGLGTPRSAFGRGRSKFLRIYIGDRWTNGEREYADRKCSDRIFCVTCLVPEEASKGRYCCCEGNFLVILFSFNFIS
ncbi:hypothetical protein Pint_18639 [Pistacia integerrima]|uniref:Uncharacterized protein n=1 Tax=Pistacia integerrima TaxID=434235 RepID=A0ACC0YV42_9ROSI|nr:hypothetical protein Pint_18639 [Pistacia integerrima]